MFTTPMEVKLTAKEKAKRDKRLADTRSYDEKQKEYQRKYWAAKDAGVDVSELPKPREFIRLQQAGGKGLPGIAFPGLDVPLLSGPGGIDPGDRSEELADALEKVQKIVNQDVKGRSTTIRGILEKLMADKRGVFNIKDKAALRKLWAGHPEFQQRILDIINSQGLQLRNNNSAETTRIVNRIFKDRDIAAIIQQELAQAFRDQAEHIGLDPSWISENITEHGEEFGTPIQSPEKLQQIGKGDAFDNLRNEIMKVFEVKDNDADAFIEDLKQQFVNQANEDIAESGDIRGSIEQNQIKLINSIRDIIRTNRGRIEHEITLNSADIPDPNMSDVDRETRLQQTRARVDTFEDFLLSALDTKTLKKMTSPSTRRAIARSITNRMFRKPFNLGEREVFHKPPNIPEFKDIPDTESGDVSIDPNFNEEEDILKTLGYEEDSDIDDGSGLEFKHEEPFDTDFDPGDIRGTRIPPDEPLSDPDEVIRNLHSNSVFSIDRIDTRQRRPGRGGGPPPPPPPPIYTIVIGGRRFRVNHNTLTKLFGFLLGAGGTALASSVAYKNLVGKTVSKSGIKPTKKPAKKPSKPVTPSDDPRILPPNKAPAHFIDKDKASPLEITDQFKSIGLKPSFTRYNALVERYNNETDPANKAELKRQLNTSFQKISDTIQLQTRADDAKPVTRVTHAKLPPIDIKDRVGANKWTLTQELKEAGYGDEVAQYNKYAERYNQAVTDNETDLQDFYKFKMGQIKLNAEDPHKTRAASLPTSKELMNDLNQKKAEREMDYNNLMAAVQRGADQSTLDRLSAAYGETSENYMDAIRKSSAISDPKTYLGDIRKEHFPENAEDAKTFNELQTYEQFLHMYPNPNDKSNQALRDYNAQIAGKEGDFQYRLRVIKHLMETYQVDPKHIKTLETIVESRTLEDLSGDKDHTLTPKADTKDDEFATEQIEDFEQPMRYMGGEARLLLQSEREQEAEQKRWDDYSLVQRGFGNGRFNPLYLETLRNEHRRFGPLHYPNTVHQPVKEPARKPQNDVRFQNIYMFDTGFEDEYDNSSFPLLSTPEHITTNKQSDWENDHSIYFPEHALRKYRSRPVRIPRMRTDGIQFAPSSYSYGEPDLSRSGSTGAGTAGVVNDALPYENAYGFPQKQRLSSIEYAMARK